MMESLVRLQDYIRRLESAVVGFSGGVDSALLAFVAHRVLGPEKMLAVTGDSASVPSRDREFVAAFCREHGIPHRFIPTYEQENPDYQANPSNRCFFCKEELYLRLRETAVSGGWRHVLDGTNMTDLKGHRPGFEALQKAGVTAPFVDLKIDKATVRQMAGHLGLGVADKPQSACLASRVPTGVAIDIATLQKIDVAENRLRDLGVANPRVRFHGELARIELKKEDWNTCLEKKEIINDVLTSLGFKFVTLDLKEYSREG